MCSYQRFAVIYLLAIISCPDTTPPLRNKMQAISFKNLFHASPPTFYTSSKNKSLFRNGVNFFIHPPPSWLKPTCHMQRCQHNFGNDKYNFVNSKWEKIIFSKNSSWTYTDLYHTGVCLMYFWLIVVFKAYIFPPYLFFANNAKVGRGEGNSEPKNGGHNF